MGTKGREIVGTDIKRLIAALDQAFADEWLAYYQYWIGAAIAKGPMRKAVVGELLEHAADELRHAEMLTTRIIQLGGTPVTDPRDWDRIAGCKYQNPTDPHVAPILEQAIKGEQCAIGAYTALLKTTEGKDPITYQIAVSILKDEVEHEEDLQALMSDLEDIPGHH